MLFVGRSYVGHDRQMSRYRKLFLPTNFSHAVKSGSFAEIGPAKKTTRWQFLSKFKSVAYEKIFGVTQKNYFLIALFPRTVKYDSVT